MESGPIEISEFPLTKEFFEKSNPSLTLIAIGVPGSGKTFFLNFLAYAGKHVYPVGCATCGTEGSQGAFSPTFGPLFTNTNYREEDQIEHARRQKLCIQEGVYPYMIEIIDDCSDDPKIYKSKIMRGSFKNGRQHWKRLFAIGLQGAIDMKSELRNLVSYVVLFRQPDYNAREMLYKNFGGICGSFKNFCKLLDQFTDGKGNCLIIKKCGDSNKLEDNVFWFKAPAWKWSDGELHPYPEGWRFGCQEFKDWNDSRYDHTYVDPII